MNAIGQSSLHEVNYYETALRVRDSVRAPDSVACIRAGTARGGNYKTRASDAILFRSVQKRELFHVIAQALFRQGRDIVVSK